MGAFAAELNSTPRSVKQLKEWAARRGLSLAMFPTADMRAVNRALAAKRAARGLPPLPVCLPGGQRVAPPAGEPPAGPVRRSGNWKKPEIIVGLAVAIRKLGSASSSRKARLKQIARENPGAGIPSWSVVDRCRRREHPGESWHDWVMEATSLARSAD